jgi:thymidine kinase
MNAGKSTAMLQVAHNYEEQDQQVRLFTAAIDNRYGVGKVTRAWVRSARPKCSTKHRFPANHRQESRLPAGGRGAVPEQGAGQAAAPAGAGARRASDHLRPAFGLLGEPFPGSAYLLALATISRKSKTSALAARKRP